MQKNNKQNLPIIIIIIILIIKIRVVIFIIIQLVGMYKKAIDQNLSYSFFQRL